MRIVVVTDAELMRIVLRALEKPMTLSELRAELRAMGILVSYTRLRRIVAELVQSNRVVRVKCGKAVLYAVRERESEEREIY